MVMLTAATRFMPDSGLAAGPPLISAGMTMTEDVVEPPWFDTVLERLEQFLELPRGWDAYDAAPVSLEAAQTVLTVLALISDRSTPEPTLVPLPSGGVQIEWYYPRLEIEVEVHSALHLTALCEDVLLGEEEELELSADLSPLVRWIHLFPA